MDSELLGSTAIVKIIWSHGASGVSKPKKRLQLWVDSLAGSLFNNTRRGIRSLSYANMKGTPPINVTSETLEWSQGTKGKKCGFLPIQLIPFFRGSRWWRGKTGRESVPCIKNLGSFAEWVRVSILFWNWISVVFLSPWAVGWLHTQLVRGTVIINRIYFWGVGSNKNLEFPSRVIYSSKMFCFVLFLFHVILMIDWYVFLWCSCICLKMGCITGKQRGVL